MFLPPAPCFCQTTCNFMIIKGKKVTGCFLYPLIVFEDAMLPIAIQSQ